MNKTATLQDSIAASLDPATICSFDYEAIQEPTKALIHQAARFLYIKHGRGEIVIDGTSYDLAPNTIVAITPWKITEITRVDETFQFIKVVYDHTYINTILKGVSGLEEDCSELLRFLSMEPVVLLDSVQAKYMDALMEQLKAELGVESTRMLLSDQPLTQIYTTIKLIELMIVYRRYVLSQHGENTERKKQRSADNSVLSYIYAHSSEKLTLPRVAEVFFVSESTLSKQLSERTGLTFMKLLNSIRIEKASDYLIYTDLTLDEIAGMVGYVDASHLSKHFSGKVGVTPINYRKIYAKSKPHYNRTDKNTAFAVTDYIFKNYQQEDLSASQTASQFGISVSEMNRLLLYHSEKNFENLLNSVRINKACELLATTDRLVIDVAFEVGYNNIRTFNLNFYKYKEMTPTEFRGGISLQKADGSETDRKRSQKARKAKR
ncbi:MAG: AraC family transcriptional regulator [Subdoligranulum sp.]|nr:AraC family transcriptional regulator [Subdoligranulum sp.]